MVIDMMKRPAGGGRHRPEPEAAKGDHETDALVSAPGGREIGLHTYGVLIGCGCAVGIVLAFREARRQRAGWRQDPRPVVLDAGHRAARFAAVLRRAERARLRARLRRRRRRPDRARSLGRVLGDCTHVLQVWEGGLVFYGGFIGAGSVRVILRAPAGLVVLDRSAIFSPRRWRSGTRSGGSAASPPAAASARRATWRRTGARASAPTASLSRSCGRWRPSRTAPR